MGNQKKKKKTKKPTLGTPLHIPACLFLYIICLDKLKHMNICRKVVYLLIKHFIYYTKEKEDIK